MLSDLQTRKILKFFSMYDTNCDGFLVSGDFENIVKRLAGLRNLSNRSGKYLSLQDRFTRAWKALEAHADLDHDHRISLKEWLSYYQSVLENEQKYQEELHTLMGLVFEVFDENEDGKISKTEWEQLFSIYNICPIYAVDVFQKLDQNQDGSLDRSEVMDLIYHFFYSDNPDHPGNQMFGPY